MSSNSMENNPGFEKGRTEALVTFSNPGNSTGVSQTIRVATCSGVKKRTEENHNVSLY